MGTARVAAPEIDRLVISVHRAVGPRHGRRLAAIARNCGLDHLELLPDFGGFLMAGTLTRSLATARMRYRPQARVLDRLDELERKGLVRTGARGLEATATLRPLLEAMATARADVAAAAWRDHEADVATVTDAAGAVGAAASPDHAVAVAHRILPEPQDPYLLLERRLATLRYVRQHDHTLAWLARGMTAPEMTVFTALWHDDAVPPAEMPAGLVRKGLVDPDSLRLTPLGVAERDAIETDTNDRAQRSFDVLDTARAAAFLAALRRLPGATR